MLGWAKQLQVFDAVVSSVTVDVMNMLIAAEQSSDVLLHHQAVLSHPAPFVCRRMTRAVHQYVSARVPRLDHRLIRRVKATKIGTSSRAEFPPFGGLTTCRRECAAAPLASQLNCHRRVFGPTLTATGIRAVVATSRGLIDQMRSDEESRSAMLADSLDRRIILTGHRSLSLRCRPGALRAPPGFIVDAHFRVHKPILPLLSIQIACQP